MGLLSSCSTVNTTWDAVDEVPANDMAKNNPFPGPKSNKNMKRFISLNFKFIIIPYQTNKQTNKQRLVFNLNFKS